MEEGEYKLEEDNQLLDKQKESQTEEEADRSWEGDIYTDGTIEKGLGPTDALLQSGKPHSFQPYTMEILKTEEQKADWQDKDQTIKLVKTWLREKRTPTNLEMNYRDTDVQSYRKFMTSMELRPVEGTETVSYTHLTLPTI